MATGKITRRRMLKATAAGLATGIVGPHIRTAHAAGSLSVGFWDHWVPTANDVLTKLCNDWAKKEKVDVIGLSGLITPSLDEMQHVAREMERDRKSVV